MAQKVYFLATDSGNDSDSDLWVSDGTQAGTTPVGGIGNFQVGDAATGGLGAVYLTVFGNQMIFGGADSLNDGANNGLWLTDGTKGGTTEVGGKSPGPGKSSPITNADPSGLAPSNFTTFGSEAIFTGTDSGSFDGLWVTDGTVGGTLELGGPGNSQIAGSKVGGFSTKNFAAFNNSVLFDGTDDSSATGFQGLWISDGTTTGTVEIGGPENQSIGDVGQSNFIANNFITLGALELFAAPNAQGNDSLWVTDGTAGGTVEVGGNGNLAVGGGYNTNLGDGLVQSARLGNRVLFAGVDTQSGTGLWATDGTAPGTTEIGGFDDAGVNNAAQSASPNGLQPQDITVNGPSVLFNGATGDASNTNELWVSDGTAVGTKELSGGLAGEASSGLNPTDIVSLGNGNAVFIGYDSNDNNKPTLWVTDGTSAGTQEIGGLNNIKIPDANADYGLTPQIDTLVGGDGLAYFTAANTQGTQTSVLWETDGTVGGTKIVPGTDVDSDGLIPAKIVLGPVPAADDSFTTPGESIMLANEPGEEVNLSNSTAASPDIVTGSNGTINLIAAAVATIIGGGNLISSLGKSNSVTLSGTKGNRDTVNTGTSATKGAITLSGAQAIVEGQYDTITFASGTTGNVLYLDNPFLGSIAGFTVGDTIDFLNVPYAAGDFVSFVGNGSQSGGAVTVDNASGTAVASFVVTGNYKPSQFTVSNLGGTLALVGATGVAHQVDNDFNGDGSSDIAWRNASGDVVTWNSNGAGAFTSKDLGVFPNAWRIEGTGDFNGDGRADFLWRNVNGDVQIKVSNGTGGFISKDLGVVSNAWQIAGVGDFNGDHETDVLWRNRNGDVEVWDSNGTGGFTGKDLGIVPSAWQIAGVGDFNGDGDADILWRNTSGEANVWYSNGSGGLAGKDLGLVANTWQVAGVDDFNGDGKSDILWRNANGDTNAWEANGSSGFTGKDLGTVPSAWQVDGNGVFIAQDLADIFWVNSDGAVQAWDANGAGGFSSVGLGTVTAGWQIAGTGDFNGDGKPDILWRNANGDTVLWDSNGAGTYTGQDLGVLSSAWQIAGTGDFNGDGQSDILWRNTNGDTVIWNSNGSGGFASKDYGVVSSAWQIAGTGDFNGDGKADILWRNANGDTEIWNSNGSGGFTGKDLGVVPNAWQIAGTGDFNGDGEADILWRNTNGDTVIWDSNGSGAFTSTDLGVVANTSQIAGVGDFNGDGAADILWRSTNGDTNLWASNGSGGFTHQDLGVMATTWKIQGV